MHTISLRSRVRLQTTSGDIQTDDGFGREVLDGLTADRKSLPCRYFYDAKGSVLFDEICELPEYYLTRREREILDKRADELVARLPENVTLIELGSGSSTKTRIVIEAILRQEESLRYVPIDISRSAVEESSLDLARTYEDLEIEGVIGEYGDGLRHMEKLTDVGRLILWLGSSVGNLERSEAADFLAEIRANMSREDRLLVGIDLRKSRDVLERAYDDAAGVTARFNKNVLERINRELGGHFDVDKFHHRAIYDENVGRVEIFLVSDCAQTVRIDDLDVEIPFDEGEAIHTENSHKYSLDEIDRLASHSGLRVSHQWFDSAGHFSVNLFAVV